MKPQDLSRELRRIATAIDNSKNPSKELVIQDLRKLIASDANKELKEMGKNFKALLDSASRACDEASDILQEIGGREDFKKLYASKGGAELDKWLNLRINYYKQTSENLNEAKDSLSNLNHEMFPY
jgi:hypothetical protein